MRDLGWACEGVEPDGNSVRVAREAGLEVREGQLADQAYPDARFDAVTLKHVIEHVYDARAVIRECARILKPGGRLVLFTPNPASLGHRRFGKDWRGLEPPRHLLLVTPPVLAGMAREAGLSVLVARTSARTAELMWRESVRIARGRPPSPGRAKLLGKLFALEESLRLRVDPLAGEETILVAAK
jgi:SAM-dependent methyltransferase